MSELNTHDDHNPNHPANQIEVEPELTREQELENEVERLESVAQSAIDAGLTRKTMMETAKSQIDELIEYCEATDLIYILKKLKKIEL